METRHYKVLVFGLTVIGLYFAYKYFTIKQRAVTVEKSAVVIAPGDPKNNTGIVVPPPTISAPAQPSGRYSSYLNGPGYVADGLGY